VSTTTNKMAPQIAGGSLVHATFSSSSAPKGITKINPNVNTQTIMVIGWYFSIKGFTNTRYNA